jgi:hypothetical protein
MIVSIFGKFVCVCVCVCVWSQCGGPYNECTILVHGGPNSFWHAKMIKYGISIWKLSPFLVPFLMVKKCIGFRPCRTNLCHLKRRGPQPKISVNHHSVTGAYHKKKERKKAFGPIGSLL